MSKNKKNLVVGAGLTGSIIARRIAEEKKEKVTVIERRSHVGGNCYDYKDMVTGITVHKYGAHIFHTDEREAWDYLSRFTEWHYYDHEVAAIINGQKTWLPFNFVTIYNLYPEAYADKLIEELIDTYGYGNKVSVLTLSKSRKPRLRNLGEFVKKHVFEFYTEKQWGVKIDQVSKNVLDRVPIYIDKDTRYFKEKYQGIPKDGYTKMFEALLDHKNIEVSTLTEFDDSYLDYENIYYTGSIDEFYGYCFGKLPYRSLEFETHTYNRPFELSAAVMNYPDSRTYTRAIEHKWFLDEVCDKTIVTTETPTAFVEGKNERFYPIENQRNLELFKIYKDFAGGNYKVYFLGRLGDYRYYDMDDTVMRALRYKLD